MLLDLQRTGPEPVACQAKVCIIGAGTAGIFLAHQLRRRGLQVMLLEAGNNVARRPEAAGQQCEQRGIHYRGAESGRSFGLGGTSVLWGGQMIPLTPSDMAARPSVGMAGWPVDHAEIVRWLPAVRALLGLPPVIEPGEPSAAATARPCFEPLRSLSDDLALRLSEWLPFSTRNFAKAFENLLKGDDGLTVWLNAAVTDIRLSADGDRRVTAVIANSPTGQRLEVQPETLVVCAGALESTRLMLAMDEANGGAITQRGAPLGQHFADHLSVTCGRFACRDWRRFNLAVAPVFDEGIMRTPRLELTGDAQQRLALTSAFAHFTFVTQGDTGFDVVRSLLRHRQGEGTSVRLSPGMLGRVVADVSAMAYWRSVHRRLWIPRQAQLLLQVDIEQAPNAASRVILGNTRDALGRKRLVIDWQITPDDRRVIRSVTDLVASAWQQSSLATVAPLQVTLPEEADAFNTLYDVYHPTGTLRMGRSARDSVVDQDLRLWAASNCYVSSTAVFPSAGSANPGMMHLALAARLADHLHSRLH